MLRIVANPKLKAKLIEQTQPVSASQPEAIPFVYFDTQSITTGQTSTSRFFATVQTDKTLGNLEQQGTIPDPYFFEIEAFNVDWLGSPTTALPGVLNDLANFLHVSRATFVFALAGKEYLRIPATYLHCSGGPIGIMSSNITPGAGVGTQFAVNSLPDGGFYVGKAITIPPKQSFSASIEYGAAITVQATTNVRLSMAGVLHRRVL